MTTLDRTVTVRLSEDEYQRLVADAARRRVRTATRARELVLAGILQSEMPAALEPKSPRDNARLEALVRRATWAVIVCLSTDPRFDEAGTESFLNAVLP